MDTAQIRGSQNVLGILNPGSSGHPLGPAQFEEKQIVVHNGFSRALGPVVDEHEIVLMQCPAQDFLLLLVI